MPAGLPVIPGRSASASPTPRRLGVGALATLVVLPALARVPVRDPAGGQAHTVLAQEVVACAAAAILAFAAGRMQRDRIAKIVGILVVLEVLCAVLAPNPWAALRASCLLVSGLATFVAARSIGEATSAPVALAAAVAISVVLEATGVSIGWSRTGHAPGGLVGERNAASELLVCAMPFVACVAVRGARAHVRAIAVATLALATAAVILTRTRSAWLALAALAALGVTLAWRTSDDGMRARAGLAVLATVAGIGLAAALPSRLTWTSAHPYRETLRHLVDPESTSGAGRLVQYATTLKMTAAHPLFGVGPGNWAGQYVAFAPADDPTVRGGFSPTNRLPSSDLLGFLAERGAPAFLALVALGLELARGRDRDRWLRRATLLAVIIVGSLDAVLQLGPHLLLVAWVLGSAAPAVAHDGARAPLLAVSGAAAIGALFASLRLVSFLLAVRAPGWNDLERATALDRGNVPLHLAVAESWIEAGRCDRARPHLDDAARFAAPTAAASALAARCP